MTIREIKADELDALLLLYTQLHDNPMPAHTGGLQALWENILNDKNHHIVVAVEGEKIVSSCVILVIPNLTHAQRPYALIENVVTDASYRQKGLASACLTYAKELALKENCYKIMLLTGAKESGTLQFYEKAGFNRHDKTAFIQWLDP